VIESEREEERGGKGEEEKGFPQTLAAHSLEDWGPGEGIPTTLNGWACLIEDRDRQWVKVLPVMKSRQKQLGNGK